MDINFVLLMVCHAAFCPPFTTKDKTAPPEDCCAKAVLYCG